MGNDSSKPTRPCTPPPRSPSPPRPSKELNAPWRTIKWSEKEAILKELEDLKPPLEPLRILLHGPVGAGKSCFINSVQRVFLGRNVMCALESSTTAIQGESFTLSISTYKMKKQGGGYYPIVFSDIMGLETDRDGIQIEDIIKVLEGHILEGYKFHPRESIANDDKRYNPIPSLGDKIHCLVSIIPADTISRMDDSVIDKMRKIRKKASELNLPQVLVLTKVDTACDIVSQDLRKLYHSKKIKEKVEVSSHKLGIPLKNIYPIKNYHSEITEDANVDVLIVMALRDIVNFANDYVDVRVQLAPPAASSGRRQQGAQPAPPAASRGRRQQGAQPASPAASRGRWQQGAQPASPAASRGRWQQGSQPASPAASRGRRRQGAQPDSPAASRERWR